MDIRELDHSILKPRFTFVHLALRHLAHHLCYRNRKQPHDILSSVACLSKPHERARPTHDDLSDFRIQTRHPRY